MLKNKLIIIFVGIYLFCVLIMPFLLTKAVVPVCANISENSQYEIVISEPKISINFLPKLNFKAKHASIKMKQSKNTIEVSNLNFCLRILPLISKRIHIDSVELGDLNITLNLFKEFVLQEDFFKEIQNSKIRCDLLRINSYDIKFFQKNITLPIRYLGHGFFYQHNNSHLKMLMNSKFLVGDKTSSINLNLVLPKNNDIKKTIFNIEISNPDISRLKIYFKNYLPQNLVELKGAVDIKANKGELITTLKNVAFVMKEKTESIILPETMIIKSKFGIKRDSIILDHININSKNINIAATGNIKDYFGKAMPSFDIKLLINQSNLNDIIKILPSYNLEELNIYKLKKFNVNGTILGNLAIKGRLPEPDIVGNILLSNLTVLKPIPNTKTGGVVKLNFQGKRGYTEKVEVNGFQELYGFKNTDMRIRSSQNVDLHVAQEVLNPLHEILNFIIGPVPIMEIYGKGHIDITAKGNRKNPHVWGILNLNNVVSNFTEASQFKITNTNAVLKFNDQEVNFTTHEAKLFNKDIELTGNANLFGKFNFKVKSSQQLSKDLYNAIKNASLTPDFNNIFPQLNNIKGVTDFNLSIYGNVKTLKDINFNKNVFFKGDINIKNNSFLIQNTHIHSVNSDIKIDGLNSDITLNGYLEESLINVMLHIKNKITEMNVQIPRLNPNFILRKYLGELQDCLPYISINAKYSGNSDNIDYKKLNFNSKILNSNSNSNIKYSPNGEIILDNNKLILKNITGYIQEPNNKFKINLKVSDVFDKTSNTDGDISISIPDLKSVNDVINNNQIPLFINKYLKDFNFKSGNLDLNCIITNNKFNSLIDLSGISLEYLPLELPVEFVNGSLLLKNDDLKINKVNLLADNMPILFDGEIKDFLKKRYFDIYINSKPRQDFIDKYINKNQIYPIKIKGDIVYWAKLKGNMNDFELKSKFDMSKDSSIYHFGATIGDIENAISLYLDSRILTRDSIKIKEFSYDKLIDSQNGRKTELNLLKTRGGVKVIKDDLEFSDLIIKTSNPTDARIFNIIFRKPNIKQGQFTSDLKLNGKLSEPRIIGNFHIFETDIPFFDTNMKNIELDFKDKVVEIISKGEVLGNEVFFKGLLKNKLTKPYSLEQGTFYTKDLNLDHIVNMLKTSEVENVSTFESFERLSINSILFKKLTLKAKNITLRNIHATDFQAITELNSKGVLSIDKFKFNIAQGELSGKYKYNTVNENLELNLIAESINANDITYALFDLNNQIYGDLTGKINFNCEGSDFNRCLETISGESIFNVKNGKMPKLGSLEYLLKAGNLVKGGITGLSINNVVDLITPQKTGEFSDIYGTVRMKDGVARNIEITTKGKDLSLFLTGTYNFATSIANMEVLGLLSRKISTMLGPIGNLSINTLFNLIPGIDLENDSELLENINKIPGIELSNKAYRKFIAIIKGNINGDDYVTSFKWIN